MVTLTISQTNPLGLTSPIGFNMAWIVTHLGNGYQGNSQGGYQYGFTTQWDKEDIINKLTLLQYAGVKYLRIWLNMGYYMNTNSNGFVSFDPTFLKNLDTLINIIIPSLGMKAYVCLEDNYFTFQWAWLNNPTQSANYVLAYTTIFTRYANNTNIWGWDFFNEGNGKWDANGVSKSTIIAFFTLIYNAGKSISPTHYFSPGARAVADTYFDVCSDMYDIHLYNNTGVLASPPASQFTQPVILSECGDPTNNLFAANPTVIQNMFINAIQAGYGMVMPWSSVEVTENFPPSKTYGLRSGTLQMMNKIKINYLPFKGNLPFTSKSNEIF